MAQYKVDIDSIVELRREYEYLISSIPLKKEELAKVIQDLGAAKIELDVVRKESRDLKAKTEADAVSSKEEIAFKQKKLSEFEGTLNVRKRQLDQELKELSSQKEETQAQINHFTSVKQAAEDAERRVKSLQAENDLKHQNQVNEIESAKTKLSLLDASLEAERLNLAEKSDTFDQVMSRCEAEERTLAQMRGELGKRESLAKSKTEELAERERILEDHESINSKYKAKLDERETAIAEKEKFLANKEKSLLAVKAELINRNADLREKANTAKLTWHDVEL
jgi:chromosome segregation ATPase